MNRKHLAQGAILAALFALYLLISASFIDGIGETVLLAAAAPIVAAGLFYGVRGGIAMAVLTVVGGSAVTGGLGQLDGWGPAIIRTVVGVGAGWLTGSLRTANLRITAELASRADAEHALSKSEERYRVMAETATDGIISIDGDGQVMYANPAIERILGYSPEDLVGSPLTMIIPESLRDAHLNAFQAYQSGGQRTLSWDSIQVPGRHISGREIPLELSFGELLGGHDVVFTGIVRDMTERQRTAEKLEGLLDSKDRFIAAVSHELRTPLTAVVGFAHELRSHLDELPPETVRELVGMVAEQASDVANIVEDLLVAARADSDQLTVIPTDVDLAAEARQVIAEGVRYPDGTTMPVEFLPEEAYAFADGVRVRQIVRNLLTNAARYGGQPVTLRISRGRDRAELTVVDRGPGVPGGHESKIFDAYHRIDSVAKQGSVGLGLTVSHVLAERMAGDLTYARVDGETQFTLSLPDAASSREATVA